MATIAVMARGRPSLPLAVLTLAGSLAAAPAWAGPPPPPPEQPPSRPGATAPPPPNSTLDPGGGGGGGGDAPRDPLSIDQTAETDITGAWKYSRSSGSAGPNYVRTADDDEDPFFTVNPIGYYQGVTLGGGNLPPFAPREVGGKTAVLTWTGFERLDAGSRVFVQLSAAVEPEVVVAADKVVVTFPHTAVQIRNNRRKLITRFFKTPVDEVEIVRKGKTVQVVLELRWPSEPTWKTEPGANGYQLFVLEFGDVGAKADTSVEGSPAQPPAQAEPEPVPPAPTEPAPDSTDPFLPAG